MKRQSAKKANELTTRLLFNMGLYYSVKWVVYLEKTLSVSMTQTHKVVGVSPKDRATINATIATLHTVRANTYNKLGSMQRWGKSWMSTQNIIKALGYDYQLEGLPLPAKIFEWTVQDTVKNILAQQEAAKAAIIKRIYARFPIANGKKLSKEQKAVNSANKIAGKNAIAALKSFDTIREIPWLHRYVREEYRRGYCRQNRQIVLQPQAYTCKRLSRWLVELQIQSPVRGKRLSLKVRTNRIITGQIRVIVNDAHGLEIHNLVTLHNCDLLRMGDRKDIIGVDRGYTEVLFTSEGKALGTDFGEKLTKKTDRITRKGRNKNQLWALANVKYATSNPAKADRIRHCNLGNSAELKRRNRDESYVETVVNAACRNVTEQAGTIAVESLIEEITSSKRLSRKARNRLNKWQKGTVRDSLSRWANRNHAVIAWVNAAYTSQVDSLTGTLLGHRDGDRFIRFTGDVLQADQNAANNVKERAEDADITRYMKYRDVQGVLIRRTALFLADMGLTLKDVFDRGWLDKKHCCTRSVKNSYTGCRNA